MARKSMDQEPDATAGDEGAAKDEAPAVAPVGRSRRYQTRGLIKTGHGMIMPGTEITASDVASKEEFAQMVKDGHIVPLVYLPTEA